MKFFLIKFALFIFLILVISFILDFFISYRLKSSRNLAKGEYAVWNDIYNGKVNADLVVYGSSRAWVHIDPELLTEAFNISAYNLGIDGHGFLLQYFRHKELLKFNKRPKIIIHSLDITSFIKNPQLYNYEQFLPYMLFNKNILTATSGFEGFKIWDFIIPSFRYAAKKDIIDYAFTKQGDADLPGDYRIKGYQGMDKVWNDDLVNAKTKIKSYQAVIDSSILQQFEKYLAACKENNIKIILVYTPEYIEGQKFETNREEVMQLFKNISTKFSLPFYDYSNDSISYQRNYFYNAEHLNKTGSTLFTKLFIADLKRDNQVLGPAAQRRTAVLQ